MGESNRPNIIVVVSDTLRTAYLGCYGNEWVKTPNIDAFAAEGLLLEQAHPESLPTIPMRRTMHTGRRVYPFNTYEPLPWDDVYLPGWQPMDREEPTVAETLHAAGYRTGFYADVPHYFVPGMNFTRGFEQWEYVRGQSEDRWNARATADERLLPKYFHTTKEDRIRCHIVNVRPERGEEAFPTARTFRSAIRFVEEQRGDTPFYLYVDTFSPHESWEAPYHYYSLYGDPAKRVPLPLTMPYKPIGDDDELREILPTLRANYAGLVSMVDRWFGELVRTVDRLGMGENTLIVFTSDHGTNFGDNALEVVGKPASYLYPGTMDVPLIVRFPDGAGAGERKSELAYSMEIPATVMAAAGIQTRLHIQSEDPTEGDFPVEGQDLRTLIHGRWTARPYLTCRYGNYLWYKDGTRYFFGSAKFEDEFLFDLESDPACEKNIADKDAETLELIRTRLMADAGGVMVSYEREQSTDALGRPVFSRSDG